MKMTNRIIAMLALLLLLSSLVSCAAKSEAMDMAVSTNGNYYALADMEMEYVKSESASVTGKPTSVGSAMGTATDSAASVNASEFAAKIIKTVTMNTETKEYDKAISELNRLIGEHGGFVESSSSNGQSLDYSGVYRRNAKYTVRIPAERLESFLSASLQLLNVTYSHSTSENITAEYYDIQSRLEVLRTERDALNGMLEKATDVDSMLSIRDRLYNVIEEIEAYETRLRVYDSLVSYSTVHLTVDEVVEYTKVKVEEPTWGERLIDAFTESWQDFADGFQDFTVGFLYAIPTLMVLGVIAAAGVFLLRLFLRRRAALKAKHAEEKNADQPKN